MPAKSFASSADLGVQHQVLEVLADGVYALTAEGDPNLGAIEGEDFLVCFEALATPTRHRLDVLERAAGDPAARAEVDSGRLAEPFWYVDSPLTTPDGQRPFPGRPARGDVPVPAPGVLVPDCPVTVAGRPDVVRLRQLARAGITVLLGDEAPSPDLPDTGGLPVSVHRLGDLDAGPVLRAALGARPGETWVLRPDAHVAAVLTRPEDVAPAVARLLARPQEDPLPPAPRRLGAGPWRGPHAQAR